MSVAILAQALVVSSTVSRAHKSFARAMLGETWPDEPCEEGGHGVELQAGTPLSATHVWNLETPSPSFRTPGSVF